MLVTKLEIRRPHEIGDSPIGVSCLCNSSESSICSARQNTEKIKSGGSVYFTMSSGNIWSEIPTDREDGENVGTMEDQTKKYC